MKDLKILKELRANSLASMKDEEYAMLEEQVAQKGIKGLDGYAKRMIEKGMRDMAYAMKKALTVSAGDMVSWNSSGGRASGKVIRVVSDGKINVPDSSFTIEGKEDDPAALIQLYRDGKPTETKVGHKVSTLKKD
jgi:plastocyanin